jgi:RecA-family ATPase
MTDEDTMLIARAAQTVGMSGHDFVRKYGQWTERENATAEQTERALHEAQKIVVPSVAPVCAGKLRQRRVDLRHMLTTKPVPIDMVLHGLPLGSLGVVLGSGGVGKSMMMLSVAHAVATGTDTLGCLLPKERVTHSGRVVYLAGEDDSQIIHLRTHAFASAMREDVVDQMEAMIDIVPLVGTAPALLDVMGNANEGALAEIREAAKGTRLLIIDPLRQFHSGDENDNGMMTTLSKALAKIACEERCSIIVVHHTSKAGAKDEDADAAASRGASAITDNARWVMALRKLSEKTMEDLGLLPPAWRYVTTRKVKANYAALGDATILTRGNGGIFAPTPVLRRDALAETIPAVGVSMKGRRLPRTAADLLAIIGDDDAA